MSNTTCPTTNKGNIDQSQFWVNGSFNWDAHRIGWAVSGGCAALTVIITLFTVLGHARNYHVRDQQRQIIRILYMPPVFAIISFFSYRFFRAYTYYELAQVIYEAFTISAFTLLIIAYVAETASDNTAEAALQRKDKKPLPFPFCCWRYRPTKAYFMYTVKWSVMQYVIIRPLASIAGIICEAFDILCVESYSPHFAEVYLAAIDFVCISIALYGLWVFYSLTKEELDGRRPFAKFLCIKLIVFFTFYQSFVFSVLQNYNIIHETEFWTATNVADGLNALATTIEMVFFALLMAWAYPNKEYSSMGPKTSIWRALWDSINFTDFLAEIYLSLKFFVAYALNKPGARSGKPHGADFGDAFGLHKGGAAPVANGKSNSARTPTPMRQNARFPAGRDVEAGDFDGASRPLYPPQERYRTGQPVAPPPSSYHPNANANGGLLQPRVSRDGVVYGQAM
ncbi:DUF300-domain-containing protein [Exidia glandulosa HHB12029]|uniref:DUF300-domain-containing protein n=1 Tax=Exidia glandulosa HHB12029 TaxID=1314781 RepID=A0A165P0L3_EXIGL|nr:DUF300-domain-containing protein [Exidia glandulosa HHB12029]